MPTRALEAACGVVTSKVMRSSVPPRPDQNGMARRVLTAIRSVFRPAVMVTPGRCRTSTVAPIIRKKARSAPPTGRSKPSASR